MKVNPVAGPIYVEGLEAVIEQSDAVIHLAAVTNAEESVRQPELVMRINRDGLRVEPRLPSDWDEAKAVRRFRGATYEVSYRREAGIHEAQVRVNDRVVNDGVVPQAAAGSRVGVVVLLPAVS